MNKIQHFKMWYKLVETISRFESSLRCYLTFMLKSKTKHRKLGTPEHLYISGSGPKFSLLKYSCHPCGLYLILQVWSFVSWQITTLTTPAKEESWLPAWWTSDFYLITSWNPAVWALGNQIQNYLKRHVQRWMLPLMR